jgi:ADP-ribose pyrophosphatase
VAVFVRHRDGRLVFIRQFRKPAERVVLELVAGILEPGEDPAAGARRELREETGYDAVRLEPLGPIFSSPGYVDERIDLFLAEVDGAPAALRLDPDERVQPAAMTEAEFRDLARRGGVVDGKTLAAWALVQCRAAGGGA